MVFQFINDNLEIFVLATLGLQVILLGLVVWIAFRTRKVNSRFQLLLKGTGSLNLEETLLQALEKSRQNETVLNQLNARQTEIKTTLMKCIQNKSVVRFNAFDNLGGEMSFAVALLDENGNGMVLSGLYGRDDSRVYAKPVLEGKSKYPLSEEEVKAINDALIKNPR